MFDPDEPNRLWVMDVTEHPTDTGKLYCAIVLDVFSRRVVGWSIADHIRSELVVDALQMAIWRRQPPDGQTIAHSDHGSNTRAGRSADGSAPPGCSARWASVGDCFDNSVVESFFGTLQLELLDEHHWHSREQLANAIFDWIECWYNPRRRHLLRHAQPRRLRDPNRGMITTNPSAKTGEAHNGTVPHEGLDRVKEGSGCLTICRMYT